MTTAAPHREVLLAEHLERLLGDTAPLALGYLRAHVQWVELAGGDVLMEQGQPGESGYLMLSGRLRIYMRDEGGTERMIREIGRGEVIGEMSLFTGEPRSATVVAVRDSVLVKLDKPQFDGLLALSPQVTLTLTRQIIRRLQTQHERRPLPAPVIVGVLPISDGVSARTLASELLPHLQRFGRVSVLDAAAMDRAVGKEGSSECEGEAGDQAVATALDEIEAMNDFVLLIADASPGPWTRRCVRHSDEILLLADATQPAAVHAAEQACLDGRPARIEAAEILVLLQPAEARMPRGTHQWLARRAVTGHVHLRRGLRPRPGAARAPAEPHGSRARVCRRRRTRVRSPRDLEGLAGAGHRSRLRRRHQHRRGDGGSRRGRPAGGARHCGGAQRVRGEPHR